MDVTRPVPGLTPVRTAIDGIDDGLVLLLAARARLAQLAGRLKLHAGARGRDPGRERQVRERAAALAVRVGVAPEVASGVVGLAIGEACRAQALASDLDQGPPAAAGRMMAATMDAQPESPLPAANPLLRLIPPPRRLAPLLRAVPPSLRRRVIERAMAQALAQPLAEGAIEFMDGRRLGIEVSDLGIGWVVELQGNRLVVVDAPAEATVRGTATDLLLLAGRREDADTLFFQRRLVLTGDTELGLTARNVLDRLPWEQVPLGLRIALNRGARLADAARAAYHARA
ncbi:MAG: SCP2 sterol-binding domain-containing protein [Thermomonas sp.]|nr:SCP2 sterol-binding domain-containing protein [Thermomonas sp.]MBK6415701.1 SCP2 sterol-binding domain-containing protein [Thermomonas sp.]MBK6924860.1 SCP2 sterol-binding domain-containing protein [Thermomonas sp.]MBK9670340.1 SCP2 sterol-binding domain-containing protein [Thermomonas sp.]MBL0229072.1 SCP2 sterol-binding domain-containing protein [Thermomonas sp.]